MKILKLLLFLTIANSYVFSQEIITPLKKIPKRIDLIFRSTGPIPWISPTKKSLMSSGYQMIIRRKYLEPFKSIIEKNKKMRKVNGSNSTPILMIYCKMSYRWFRKKDVLELFNDGSININGDRYEMTSELCFSILQLMPLGLREKWINDYACPLAPH